MANLDVPRMIRRVRLKLGLSQEGLARRLNATKGAIQHWERGRNQPDLARLFLLRSLCPPGTERKEVDGLIRQLQDRVAVAPEGQHGSGGRAGRPRATGAGSPMLERENSRLRQQIARLQATIDRRAEQLRILEDVAGDLQRQVAELRAAQPRVFAREREPESGATE
ncbi:MAG: helix-turn-helix domain-containing protein [Terriglobia bacterium]